MSEKVKISVIVPVYNVEKYLKRCVCSLINQTYTNIEIILVDDGSTDGSGKLCDSYAAYNRNVCVLHKVNGGSADARNYAIPYVRGEYISFVDSDDYVDLNFVERMVKPLNNSETEIPDMVICSHIVETFDGIPLVDKKGTMQYYKLTPERALEIMCYEQEFGTTPCAKIISCELFKKFPFLVDSTYEDLATVYKMIGNSKSIVFLNLPMYHYVQRLGSKRNNKWNPAVLDVMKASDNLLEYIDLYYPDLHKAGVQRYFFSANEVYTKAFNEEDYLKIISPIRKKLKEFWRDIKENPKIGIKQKIRYRMLIRCPIVYKKIWKWIHIYKVKRIGNL